MQQRPPWQALDLDDAVDRGDSLGDTLAPVGVKLPAARTAKTWQSLDLGESDDPPESQQRHQWQSLSFDE